MITALLCLQLRSSADLLGRGRFCHWWQGNIHPRQKSSTLKIPTSLSTPTFSTGTPVTLLSSSSPTDFLGLKYYILQNIFLTAWASLLRHFPNFLYRFFSYSLVSTCHTFIFYLIRSASPSPAASHFATISSPHYHLLGSEGFWGWLHLSLLYLEDSNNIKTTTITVGQHFIAYFNQLFCIPHTWTWKITFRTAPSHLWGLSIRCTGKQPLCTSRCDLSNSHPKETPVQPPLKHPTAAAYPEFVGFLKFHFTFPEHYYCSEQEADNTAQQGFCLQGFTILFSHNTSMLLYFRKYFVYGPTLLNAFLSSPIKLISSPARWLSSLH